MYAGRWQRLPGLHTMFNPSNPQLQSPPDMSAEKDATPTPRVLNATGRRVRSPWTATRLKKKNRQDDAEPLPGFSSDEDTSDHDEEEQDDGESAMMVSSPNPSTTYSTTAVVAVLGAVTTSVGCAVLRSALQSSASVCFDITPLPPLRPPLIAGMDLELDSMMQNMHMSVRMDSAEGSGV